MSFIGIDVAKAQLEFARRPSGETGTVANDDGGIRAPVERCQALPPTLIVLEATGGYETAVVAALAAAGLPVVVAHPRQVRDFAKATGQLAKTDALLTRRRQLIEMLTAERNRLLVARPTVRCDLQQHIRFLERCLSGADDDLHTAVKASPAWRVKDDLLQSVPGVGRVVSLTLLAELPELGRLPQGDRRPCRRGAPQSRQWHAPREAPGLRRPRSGARGALHGRPGRQPVQSGDPHLLSTPARRGQAGQGRAHRLYAEAAHHPEHDRAQWDTLAAGARAREDLIFKTVANDRRINCGLLS